MRLQEMIQHAFRVAPKNGFVLLRAKAYGVTWFYEKVWLGLNENTPLENAKALYPYCTEFEFYDIPEKFKKSFNFGIGRPQSKRDR